MEQHFWMTVQELNYAIIALLIIDMIVLFIIIYFINELKEIKSNSLLTDK